MATQNNINNKTELLTITDSTDPTKEVAFVISPIATGTTRTLTLADRDVDFSAIPTSIVTNSGTCTPAGGAFSVVGAGTVESAASGSVMTLSAPAPPAATSGFLINQTANITGLVAEGDPMLIKPNNPLFDIGTEYSTGSGLFTADQNGYYLLVANVYIDDIDDTDFDTATITIITTSLAYNGNICSPYAMKASNTHTGLSLQISIIASLDVGDVAAIQTTLADSGDTYQITSSVNGTFFSGFKMN